MNVRKTGLTKQIPRTAIFQMMPISKKKKIRAESHSHMNAIRSCIKIPVRFTSCKTWTKTAQSGYTSCTSASSSSYRRWNRVILSMWMSQRRTEDAIRWTWSVCGIAFLLQDWINLRFKKVLSDLSCCTQAGISVERKSMQHTGGVREDRRRTVKRSIRPEKYHKPQKLPHCCVRLAPATEVWHGRKRWKGRVERRQSKAVKDTR